MTFGLSMSPSLKHATPERIRTELRQIEAALATAPRTEAMSLVAGSVPVEADFSGNWAISIVLLMRGVAS